MGNENSKFGLLNGRNICGGANASKTALWNSLALLPLFMILLCPSLLLCAAARCDECQCVNAWLCSCPGLGKMSLFNVLEYVDPRSKLPSLSSWTTILAELAASSRRRDAARAERDEEMSVLGTSAGGASETGMEGYAITMLVGELGS